MNKRKGIPDNAVHPGEMLREEFLVPLGISPYALAKALKISAPRVNDIVLERRAITADTALRLARFFGNSPEFWMNLQSNFDLDVARSSKEIGRIKPRSTQTEGARRKKAG